MLQKQTGEDIPLEDQNGMYLFLLQYLDRRISQAADQTTVFQETMNQ